MDISPVSNEQIRSLYSGHSDLTVFSLAQSASLDLTQLHVT